MTSSRMKATALAGIVAVAAISACTPSLDRGTVQGKDFRPGGCETVMMSVPTGNGGMTMFPTTNCWNDSWTLHLKDETDGKTGNAAVSAEAYDRCDVGEKYPECGVQ